MKIISATPIIVLPLVSFLNSTKTFALESPVPSEPTYQVPAVPAYRPQPLNTSNPTPLYQGNPAPYQSEKAIPVPQSHPPINSGLNANGEPVIAPLVQPTVVPPGQF
jgi:hypothetical protein